MSLRRAKTLYCITAIAIAVVLDCTGGVIGWAAAVIILSGALPLFQTVSQAIAENVGREAKAMAVYVSTLHREREQRRSLRANGDHTPTTPHIAEDQP